MLAPLTSASSFGIRDSLIAMDCGLRGNDGDRVIGETTPFPRKASMVEDQPAVEKGTLEVFARSGRSSTSFPRKPQSIAPLPACELRASSSVPGGPPARVGIGLAPFGRPKVSRWTAVLGLAGALHTGVLLADGPGEGPVTWGHEAQGGHLSLEVPFTTPHRDRIEVVAAFRYTDRRLRERETMMRAWQASLPDTVDVLRVPLVWQRGESEPPLWEHWRAHRRALLAARRLGVEEQVHAAMVEALSAAPQSLGTDDRVRRFLAGHGIDAAEYEAVLASPALRAMRWEGSVLSGGLQTAGAETGEPEGVPWLLINGRSITSSHHAGSASAAFRVANRLIRETMEPGPPYHRGPTNIPELIEKLEEWSGEHLMNAGTGRFKGVYNPWRRELWSLNDTGEVRAVAREVDGEKTFWKWLELDRGRAGYAMNWRAGFYYTPREPRVRHGAFLLADWLSGGQVVELPFKGRPVGLSFTPDGKVGAQSAEGPVQGSWWLEAAALHVSLGGYGIGSWHWREVARQVGFEVPSESITPWKTELAGSQNVAPPRQGDRRLGLGGSKRPEVSRWIPAARSRGHPLHGNDGACRNAQHPHAAGCARVAGRTGKEAKRPGPGYRHGSG